MNGTNRVSFFIDGFNLYHSIVDLEKKEAIFAKWFDMASFCKDMLFKVGNNAQIESIHYFTAFQHYLNDSDVVKRHRDYIKVLENSSSQIQVIYGKFKSKKTRCHTCHDTFIKHEEKMTDVAIAIKLFETMHKNECDTAVIVSGDTDLKPSIEACKRNFPDKEIIIIFPIYRNNTELKNIIQRSWTIKPKVYSKYQLNDIVQLGNGREYFRPEGW